MVGLKIEDVKGFTSKLFVKEDFDLFLVLYNRAVPGLFYAGQDPGGFVGPVRGRISAQAGNRLPAGIVYPDRVSVDPSGIWSGD